MGRVDHADTSIAVAEDCPAQYAESTAGRVPGSGAPVTVVRAMRGSRAR